MTERDTRKQSAADLRRNRLETKHGKADGTKRTMQRRDREACPDSQVALRQEGITSCEVGREVKTWEDTEVSNRGENVKLSMQRIPVSKD